MSRESIKSESRKRYDAGSVRGEDRFYKDIIELIEEIEAENKGYIQTINTLIENMDTPDEYIKQLQQRKGLGYEQGIY